MPDIQRTRSVSSEMRAIQTAVRTPQEGFTLITTLLETEEESRTHYSISVALFTKDPCGTDARLIRDITGERGTAESLFRLITDGTVTPCTLPDVLEDAL